MLRSTQPPSRSAGGEISSSLRATRWRPCVADWGGGLSVSSKPQVLADMGNGWLHSARWYIISSCPSAATSEIVKRFWSRVWHSDLYAYDNCYSKHRTFLPLLSLSTCVWSDAAVQRVNDLQSPFQSVRVTGACHYHVIIITRHVTTHLLVITLPSTSGRRSTTSRPAATWRCGSAPVPYTRLTLALASTDLIHINTRCRQHNSTRMRRHRRFRFHRRTGTRQPSCRLQPVQKCHVTCTFSRI